MRPPVYGQVTLLAFAGPGGCCSCTVLFAWLALLALLACPLVRLVVIHGSTHNPKGLEAAVGIGFGA